MKQCNFCYSSSSSKFQPSVNMACFNCSRKGFKICLATTILLLLVILIVSVILYFTVFKPKQPGVAFHPVTLDRIELALPTFQLNITLGIVVRINNPNYGGFKFKNTTSFVNYHETVVAEVPIEDGTVPARGTLNMLTSVEIFADKLKSSPYLLDDFKAGCLNFTSTATLHGKVEVLKLFKMGARAFTVCDISVFIYTLNVETTCKSKIML